MDRPVRVWMKYSPSGPSQGAGSASLYRFGERTDPGR